MRFLIIIVSIVFSTSVYCNEPNNIEVAKNISNELKLLIEYARANRDAEKVTPGYAIEFELVARQLEIIKSGLDQITDYPLITPVDPKSLKQLNNDFQN